MKTLRSSLILLLVFGSNVSINASIIQVPSDQPTIQGAIDVAVDRDTILISEGQYYERITFAGKAITVASEFLLDGDTAHITNTIIDGDTTIIGSADTGSVVRFTNGEDSTSILAGFTIQNGVGTDVIFPPHPISNGISGGGILCLASAPSISHCRLVSNSAQYGDGIACIDSTAAGDRPGIQQCSIESTGNYAIWVTTSSPIFSECEIQGDVSCDRGVFLLTDSKIDGDITPGPVVTAKIEGSEFTGGVSYSYEGAAWAVIQGTNSSFEYLDCDDGLHSNATLTDCIIWDYVRISSDDYAPYSNKITLNRCIVQNVSCSAAHAEMDSCQVMSGVDIGPFGTMGFNNCHIFGTVETMAANSCFLDHCIVHSKSKIRNTESAGFRNCTILGTIDMGIYGGTFTGVDITNCTMFLSGDTALSYDYGPACFVDITCCNIYDYAGESPFIGDVPGLILDTSNVIFADPLFCAPDTGNYHIRESSPCAPANNDCGVLLGALDVACPACDCGHVGDINCDGSTDPLDIQFLVDYVFLDLDGRCAKPFCPYPCGDVNCNDLVSPLDVQFLVQFVFQSQDALCDPCE